MVVYNGGIETREKCTWLDAEFVLLLSKCCYRLGATVNILQKKKVSTEPQKQFVVETRVRKVPDDQLVSITTTMCKYVVLISY